MAFGQQSGPPAGGRQIEELLGMLEQVGFSGFREARHPYGLNQRQAGGKFSRDEADELQQRLQSEIDNPAPSGDDPTAGEPVAKKRASPKARSAKPTPTVERRIADRKRLIKNFPAELLAAELQSRGWVVMEPPTAEPKETD